MESISYKILENTKAVIARVLQFNMTDKVFPQILSDYYVNTIFSRPSYVYKTLLDLSNPLLHFDLVTWRNTWNSINTAIDAEIKRREETNVVHSTIYLYPVHVGPEVVNDIRTINYDMV